MDVMPFLFCTIIKDLIPFKSVIQISHAFSVTKELIPDSLQTGLTQFKLRSAGGQTGSPSELFTAVCPAAGLFDVYHFNHMLVFLCSCFCLSLKI